MTRVSILRTNYGSWNLVSGISGIAAAGVIIVAIVVSAVAYRGVYDELYSPFNHTISELGEVGVSRLQMVFNVGVVAGALSDGCGASKREPVMRSEAVVGCSASRSSRCRS